jgi:hypothetical protein
MEKLDRVYRQIPKSTCDPNCGACCGILYPSLAEIRAVKEYCATKNKPYKDFVMVGDCPYLMADKSCEIYSVRPFLCRILGVSTSIPCPLGKCHTTKMLNHKQSSILYRDIYLKGKDKPRTEKHREILKPILDEYIRVMKG